MDEQISKAVFEAATKVHELTQEVKARQARNYELQQRAVREQNREAFDALQDEQRALVELESQLRNAHALNFNGNAEPIAVPESAGIVFEYAV